MTITPGQCRAARELLGWSRTALAGHVGVSDTTIWAFESGKPRSPRLELSAVREALGVARRRVCGHRREAGRNSRLRREPEPGVSRTRTAKNCPNQILITRKGELL